MRTDIKYLSIGLIIGIGASALLLTGMLVPPNMVISQQTVSGTPITTPTTTVVSAKFSITTQQSFTIGLPIETFTYTPTLIYPSRTPTTTNTLTPTPTVPSLTPTPSGAMMALFESGYLSQGGPLSLEQQFNVFNSSLKFIRRTTKESYQLGNLINGIGNGSPSNICGPLSIAIF